MTFPFAYQPEIGGCLQPAAAVERPSSREDVTNPPAAETGGDDYELQAHKDTIRLQDMRIEALLANANCACAYEEPHHLCDAHRKLFARLPAAAEERDEYKRGQRDALNAVLSLNPEAAAEVAKWAEKEPDPEGRMPFDVALWVSRVATQLGFETLEGDGVDRFAASIRSLKTSTGGPND